LFRFALERNYCAKCGLKKRKYTGIEAQKRADLFVTNHLFSSAPPISAFSRTDEQYFVDAVSMRPVILSKTVANKQALSRRTLACGIFVTYFFNY